MSEEERNARKQPINELKELGKGFTGRREWLVLLTETFRVKFESLLYENDKLKREKQELKERVVYLERSNDRKEETIINLRMEQELDLYKSVLNEVKEIIETKFLETELYGGELVCISVENYKKVKTILDKVGGSNE